MNDWRKPCEHGRYDAHGHFDPDYPKFAEPYCPGGSPVTTADLEGLGEKIDWCVNHDSEAMHWVSGVATTCTRAYGTDEPCEFEERLLVPIPDAMPDGGKS